MKKMYRYEDNQDYWDRRWSEAGRDADSFADLDIYPVKYADMVMGNPSEHSVELGAGLGRILKQYHNRGRDIVGLELSEVAVARLKAENPELRIDAGDVRRLPYRDEQFDVVLSFGVFHNLEDGVDDALAETARCLKSGGRFCISMRPNNFEMNLNEWYWRWKQRRQRPGPPKFHKWLVGEGEFSRILLRHGLQTDRLHRARNVSLLYRVPWLRAECGSEQERRARGYQLSAVGRPLDRILVRLAPSQFCNVLVYVGHRV